MLGKHIQPRKARKKPVEPAVAVQQPAPQANLFAFGSTINTMRPGT